MFMVHLCSQLLDVPAIWFSGARELYEYAVEVESYPVFVHLGSPVLGSGQLSGIRHSLG
jgi:hypothetical protein